MSVARSYYKLRLFRIIIKKYCKIQDNTFVEYLEVEINTKVRTLVYFMEWLEIIELFVLHRRSAFCDYVRLM